jgi:hypothetical protein
MTGSTKTIHVREFHENTNWFTSSFTYGFIVEKQIDINCLGSSNNYLSFILSSNIIPAIGWGGYYWLQHNFYKADNYYKQVDGCADGATTAAIASVTAYELLSSYVGLATYAQSSIFITIPVTLISLGYSFFNKEEHSFETNSKCGIERDKILREIGCPVSWNRDINFPDTQIMLTCMPPEASTGQTLLRDICNRNKFIKDLVEGSVVTLESELENEIENIIVSHPSTHLKINCLTTEVIGESVSGAGDL